MKTGGKRSNLRRQREAKGRKNSISAPVGGGNGPSIDRGAFLLGKGRKKEGNEVGFPASLEKLGPGGQNRDAGTGETVDDRRKFREIRARLSGGKGSNKGRKRGQERSGLPPSAKGPLNSVEGRREWVREGSPVKTQRPDGYLSERTAKWRRKSPGKSAKLSPGLKGSRQKGFLM